MKIGIIGGGAIGLLVSSYLSSVHDVTIYVRRPEQREELIKDGIHVTNSSKVNCVRSLTIDEMNKEDCLIICTKQQQVQDVLQHIHNKNNHSFLIFLQNGMGHIDLLKKIGQPVLVGIVEHGALKLDDHTVQHTGNGMIKLAAFSKGILDIDRLVFELNQPEFPVVAVDGWRKLLHGKLIVNAVINPLTAMFGVRNGDIIANPYIYELAKALCRETARVLELDFPEQLQCVTAVISNTSENVSSMLKDIQAPRQTEIDAITGYILTISKKEIPYTTFVYHSVKALEMKKGIRY
ncbi:2-dehydropantoate 2-reductase [Virgibacillus byunsanensis]|uniref:2-dehydropantoate 2-reductase n=1 Tax=Virgibacillus byunsanensis TaxID=570945 RepID=A0ABW3LPE4_9BACI